MGDAGTPLVSWYHVTCPAASMDAARAVAQRAWEAIDEYFVVDSDGRRERSDDDGYEVSFYVAIGEQ